jgi:hypothetical protein
MILIMLLITFTVIFSYFAYINFIITAWLYYAESRYKNGFIEYYPGMYISEKLLLVLTFGLLILPPFVCTYIIIKNILKMVRNTYIYTTRVFKSSSPWFIQKTTQKQEGDI